MSPPTTDIVAPLAQYTTAIATARASGLASNAFETRDNHGVEPLSLPAEGTFLSFESVKTAVQNHAKLAGWAVVVGRGSRKRGGRHIKFLVCKHSGMLDKRRLSEEDRQKERNTKKCDCGVRMKVNERPDSSWELRWLEGRTEHNHGVHDASSYHEHRQLDSAQLRLLYANQAVGISASYEVSTRNQRP